MKSKSDINSINRLKWNIFICLSLLSGLAFSPVHAADCTITTRNAIGSVDVSVNTAAMNMTISNDLPIGTVLYTYGENFAGMSPSHTFSCQPTRDEVLAGIKAIQGTTTYRAVISNLPSGPAVSSGGKNIFPTNVPGIGVVIGLVDPLSTIKSSGQVITSFPYKNSVNFDNLTTLNVSYTGVYQIKIELVKTGYIPEGTQVVQGASFPSFQFYVGFDSPIVDEKLSTTLIFSGNIIAYTKTCLLASSMIDVDLGKHWKSFFTGPGSVTEWKDFDITLKDCPPFYGQTHDSFGTSYLGNIDLVVDNKIMFNFNSINGVVAGNPQLAMIENSPNSAEGVAIEVSERNSGTSLNLDGSAPVALQGLTTVDSASYTLPLKARYVQYDSEVKEGKADGALIFTISYY